MQKSSTRHPVLSLAARIAIMLVLCVCTLDADAASRVLVVMSSGSSQYRDCADQATSAMGGVEVVIKELSSIKKSDLDALSSDDVCLAIGAKAAVGIGRELDPSVPLIYTMVSDPEGLGLRGRANTAGVSADVSPADQFALLKEAYPNAKSIGMLYRSSSEWSMSIFRLAQEQLPGGWSIQAIDMDQYSSDSEAVAALIAQRTDFAWMISDHKVYSPATVKALLIASIKNKLRVFAFSPQVVKAGALIGVGIDPVEQGQSAGQMVIAVLRGGISAAKKLPSDATPHIAVNNVVADRIDVELPKKLVQKADYLYD